MSSRFVEITDFDEAVKYSEAGLLVAKESYGFDGPTHWKQKHEVYWYMRGGVYGILVEEDGEE